MGVARVVVQVRPHDVPEALARAADLLARGHDVDVRLPPDLPADVAVVGELARLRLVARRSGADLRLSGPDSALRHLAELLGLCEALGLRR